MQHDIRLPFLAGLLFALLLASFLWLERVQRRGAGLAAALVATAALGGYIAAPILDGERPLLDYEELAQSLSASATAQYRWNHDYGPLDWPRDGREVLRVEARHRSYWKAVNLTAFDGLHWVQDTVRRATGSRRGCSGLPGCSASRSRCARCARGSSSAPARRSTSSTPRARR